jgi:hypothetical protein
MTPKSPFFVVENFLSPLMCEDIIARLNHNLPDFDINDNPVKTIRTNRLTEMRVLPFIEELIPELENYYSFEMDGILPFRFEWFVDGAPADPLYTEAFTFVDNKWKRTADVGFTGIIFLNEYNNTPPFDQEFEVCGGKLNFPNHQFSFEPRRGTLVFFPEAPNFVRATSKVEAGELTQIVFHVVPTVPYNYDMNNFPGNYKSWFKV